MFDVGRSSFKTGFEGVIGFIEFIELLGFEEKNIGSEGIKVLGMGTDSGRFLGSG